jgi:hypothetical protein
MRGAGVGVLAAAWLAAAAVQAEPRDPAAAQALFDEARILERSQRYAEACAKLAESQRLDPGIGTQFHLADCYEHEGKIASAWAAFLEVASIARASAQSDREKAAQKRAAKLESRLPKLQITVPASSQIPDLTIARDDMVVGVAVWDSAVPVDPGDHTITASAPGRRAFTQSVRADEGKVLSVVVPLLEPATQSPPAASPPPPPPASTPRRVPTREEPPPQATKRPTSPAQGSAERAASASSAMNPWLVGLGAAGMVGLGVGTVFGVLARNKYDNSKDYCSPNDENRCSVRGVELRDDAFTLGNISTASFIVGGAALGTAGVVWLTTGSARSSHDRTKSAAHAELSAGIAAGTVWASGSF